MRLALMALGLAACCLGAPALAQDEQLDACAWETAQIATIEQIAANYLEWDGKCVRIRALHAYGGYATENRLLADRMAVLESDEPHQRSLGINYRVETEHEAHRPRWEEVLGTVGSCKIAFDEFMALMRANPNKLYFMGGFCHYTLDHYLLPVAYRAADAPAVARLRKSEVAADQVELERDGPDHPNYSITRETGERMFAAIDGQDFAAFLELENPVLVRDLADEGEAGLPSGQLERLADLRDGFEAATAAYRAWDIKGDEGSAMLSERIEHEDEEGVELLEGADFNAGAYWCRLRDGVEGEDLPVRVFDIDNDPSRPFFCVWTGDYVVFRQGTVPSASVPLFEYGFLERPD